MSVCVFSSRDPTRELGAKWEPTNRQPTLSPVCDICMRVLYRRCLPVRVSSVAPGSAGSGLSLERSVPSLPRLYRRALRARIRYLAHPPAWHSRRARPRLSVRCVAGVLRAHAWLAWASCRCCVACLFWCRPFPDVPHRPSACRQVWVAHGSIHASVDASRCLLCAWAAIFFVARSGVQKHAAATYSCPSECPTSLRTPAIRLGMSRVS